MTDMNSSYLPCRLGMSPEDYRMLGLEEGQIRQKDDASHGVTESEGHEWWYIDAEFDGGILGIFMTTKPMGSNDPFPVPTVTVTLRLADGTDIRKFESCSMDEFHSSEQSCDVRMGKSYFRGDLHRYEVHVEADGLVADVELIGTVAPWRPATGHMLFGSHNEFRFGTQQPVPLGEARVSVRNEGLELTGAGPGYIDRGWMNAFLSDLVHDWYWGRVQFGDYLVLVWVLIAEETYGFKEFKQFLVVKNGQILANVPADGDRLVFSPKDVHIDTETGKPVADTLDCEYMSGDTRIEVQFEREEDFFKLRMRDTMNKQQLAKAVKENKDPALMRFIGQATFSHRIGDKLIHQERKEAFWELLYLGNPR